MGLAQKPLKCKVGLIGLSFGPRKEGWTVWLKERKGKARLELSRVMKNRPPGPGGLNQFVTDSTTQRFKGKDRTR